LGDEEIHVIAAMLHNNVTMEELQFRRNNISDDGARALAAVLAERSSLKFIDLRENQVSIVGVKAIADALERSARIHKVLVHPGGKIEAFGASDTICESESTAFAIKTVCIVDLSENQPRDKIQKMANVAECRKSLASRCNSEKKKKRNTRPRKSDCVSTADSAKGEAGDATSKRHSASAPNKLNCGDGGASL
jgi:hypothetical protein